MLPIGLSSKQILLSMFVVFFVFTSNVFAQLGLDKKRIAEAQWSRGFHGLNMIAEGNELERINIPLYQVSDPADVLLVVFGSFKNLRLDVNEHVRRGGAALLASDSTDDEKRYAGFRFGKLNSYPTEESDAFGGMLDCPLVSDFQDHPIVEGVSKIATNRPGYIRANRQTLVGRLPSPYRDAGTSSFVAANENRIGGRVVAVGDQSIFTNQMMMFRDNDLFTDQTIKWLKNDRATKMLILVNGAEYSPLDPSEVVIDLPPPTKEEVFTALKNLPPSAMLDFANSVATVVEDEDMVNDFVHDTMDKIPERSLNRFYIFLLFGVACLSFVVAFLFQGKLQRQTASQIAFKRSSQEQAELKVIQARERQQAAHMLLDKFCMDLAGTRFSDWPSFPTGLDVDDDRESKNLFKSMTKMSVLYKSRPFDFWSRKKLGQLEKQVGKWREYFDSRPELLNMEAFQNQNFWANYPPTEQI